mmetsp:Transcript_730/g.2050  ORF Transcript_730/g.2050 Transcript_730/m.2050 type:complete len:228 (-) Transcript_730:167-850(-)
MPPRLRRHRRRVAERPRACPSRSCAPSRTGPVSTRTGWSGPIWSASPRGSVGRRLRPPRFRNRRHRPLPHRRRAVAMPMPPRANGRRRRPERRPWRRVGRRRQRRVRRRRPSGKDRSKRRFGFGKSSGLDSRRHILERRRRRSKGRRRPQQLGRPNSSVSGRHSNKRGSNSRLSNNSGNSSKRSSRHVLSNNSGSRPNNRLRHRRLPVHRVDPNTNNNSRVRSLQST